MLKSIEKDDSHNVRAVETSKRKSIKSGISDEN